jgi:hypothetical protein
MDILNNMYSFTILARLLMLLHRFEHNIILIPIIGNYLFNKSINRFKCVAIFMDLNLDVGLQKRLRTAALQNQK